MIEVFVSKKRNPEGNYTNIGLTISNGKSKPKFMQITCPTNKENEVIHESVRIICEFIETVGGNYYVDT